MEPRTVHLNFHKTLLLTMMMFKWGTFCSASSVLCLSSPCQNGGTCVGIMDDYACLCPRDGAGGVRHMGKDCDELYDACAFAPGCARCASEPGSSEYTCACPDGSAGANCTEDADADACASSPCGGPQSECVGEPDGYACYCPPGFAGQDCDAAVADCFGETPCLNNGTCHRLPDGRYACACARGFEGERCEEDVDECQSHPCQNGAICLDDVAEYHCFCVPGYQGYHCEIDINECASRPCENNGTCVNEKDRYVCECLAGFTGVNCEVEIDECVSGPCQNGATCHDLIGLYVCECVLGYEGADCEVNIDECASEPCQNAGFCHDMVDSYECDCSDTGFMGDHCEEDIPECASDPCQNGATCIEGVRGYTCLCWPGYEGENCEVDIDECAEAPCQNDGECFERSDPSHWETDWEFSYAHVAGYACQCQAGYTGENCTVDINECESEPCQNGGSCVDLVNGYTCECQDGFTGGMCDVNIDECESGPCENGAWCEDTVAGYTCHCPAAEPGSLPWGGRHCHVPLEGCVEHACQNAATCVPWLGGESEDEHGHTCLCPPGFCDNVCSTPTTFSFIAPGFVLVEVEVPPPAERRRRRQAEDEEPHRSLGVRLRFRTTLPDMVLFFRGDADCFLSLEIAGGGLRARAVSADARLEVAFAGLVSDGGWRDASVRVGEGGLALALRGPGCDGEGCMAEDGGPDEPHFLPAESFTQVYVGGAPEEYLKLLGGGPSFLGCMEDLRVDGRRVLPQGLPEGAVELGCSKTEWCEAKPHPCSLHGRCVDLWTSYRCHCHRPHYGLSCAEEFPSWTFSHEDITSYVSYDVGAAHGANFSVSFLLRSLKPDGLLFQLRRSGGEEERAYFSVFLRDGRVLISAWAEGEGEEGPAVTAPALVATGEKQLLVVELQHGQVFFGHEGLRYGLGEVPEVKVSEGDLAYVGGLPGEGAAEAWGGHFKGCLQDVRMDDVHLDVDAWNSTLNATVYSPNDADHVEPGCISDDTCQVEPCLNGGECTITWNDFVCTCPVNFTGKTCETRVWCVSDPCIMGGQCVDLPDGYECLANATFGNSPLQYSSEGSLVAPVTSVTMELRTRVENAVLLRMSRGPELLLVSLMDAALHVEIRSENSVEVLVFSGQSHVADGSWHRVRVWMMHPEHEASPWCIAVDGVTDGGSASDLAGSLLAHGEEETSVTLAASFAGCLGAVRLGGVYLPFVNDLGPPQPARFHRSHGDEEVRLGCEGTPVCDEPQPCRNGGICEDLFDLFACACADGWEGPLCETDTDDCAVEPCGSHGDCADRLAGFACACRPGYAGERCEEDVDECQAVGGGCENGGTCVDGVNEYSCLCPPDYSGPRCQWSFPPLQCEDVQCANQGDCNDGLWGANCTCIPGFSGDRCEFEVDECESNPCRNGGSCIDRLNRFMCVCAAGYSGAFCETSKQAQRERVPWLVVAIPLVCCCVLLAVIALTFMVLTARRKRQSEGAYSPSSQEVAGARLEMDSMLKVPPEERLI